MVTIRNFLICGCLVCILVGAANAESMMQAFQNFRNKKANNGVLPGDLKGVVCERSGSEPKSIYCYNKHGVRCSPEFFAENVCWDERRRAKSRVVVTQKCKAKGEIAREKCPQPCGCVLEGQPKRESDGMMRTQTLNLGGGSSCGSASTWSIVKNFVLKKWNVPEESYDDFEMGALFDRATFLVFDLFIQPDERRARYGLSLGAIRCHNDKIEVGYMSTGMWNVDTINTYRCHWRGMLPPNTMHDALFFMLFFLQFTRYIN